MTCAGERCDVSIDVSNNVTSDVINIDETFEENGNISDLIDVTV